MTPWFYSERLGRDDLARRHREAYEKSLTSKHAVKAQCGTYYYRGYEISNEGSREFPWSYNRADAAYDFDKEWAETKKLAMSYVDDILDNT